MFLTPRWIPRTLCNVLFALPLAFGLLSCDRTASTSVDPDATRTSESALRFSVERGSWVPDSIRYAVGSISGTVAPAIIDSCLFDVRIPVDLDSADTMEMVFLKHGVRTSTYRLRRYGESLAPFERAHVVPVRSALVALDSLRKASPSRFPSSQSGLAMSYALGLSKGWPGFGTFPADRPPELPADTVWRGVFLALLAEGATVSGRITGWGMPRDTASARRVAERLVDEGWLSATQVRTLFQDGDAGEGGLLPVVSLVSPSSPSIQVDAKESRIRVRVVAVDADGIEKVIIGGIGASAAGENQYEADVPLDSAGKTTVIEIVGVDSAGQESRRYLEVARREAGAPPDTLAPVFRLLSAPDSVVAAGVGRILVRWMLSDAAGIRSASLGDSSVAAIEGGFYEKVVPISGGINRIRFRAEDLTGNVVDTVVIVRRLPHPPGTVSSSVPSGVADLAFRVHLSVPDSGAVVRYAIGGADPDSSSPVVPESLRVDSSMFLRARAWTEGGAGPISTFSWRLVAAPVVLSDSGGAAVRSGPHWIRATCRTPGATLRYTLDGITPDSTSIVWPESLRIESSSTLRIRAFAPKFEPGPVLVAGYKVAHVVDVAMGNSHSLFLKSDGSLWASGLARDAGVENHPEEHIVRPVRILDSVVSMASGIAIRKDGSVWTWGKNNHGQLGDGTKDDRTKPARIAVCASEGGARTSATGAIGCNLVVCGDGSLWGFGDNQYGELGLGDTLDRSLPARILDDVSHVASGAGHSLAIKKDGSLWAWGANFDGQLGNGSQVSTRTPITVPSEGIVWKAIAANSALSLAVSTDGDLYSFGTNYRMMSGTGPDSQCVRTPTKILSDIAHAAVGAHHALAVSRSGIAWSWGYNEFGSIGDGSTFHRPHPVNIGSGVSRVAGSYWSSLLLLADGTLLGAGLNDFGELGLGDRVMRRSPTKVIF